MKFYDIFISYASVDINRVINIIQTLEEMGYNCWYAPRDITPGSPYAREIIKGIETCPIFMVVLTEDSVSSDNVLNEVENAHTLHKTIIPVFLNSLTLPPEMNFYLRRLHWATLDETKSANLLSALGLPSVEAIRKSKDGKVYDDDGKRLQSNLTIRTGSVFETTPHIGPHRICTEDYTRQINDKKSPEEKHESSSQNDDTLPAEHDLKPQFMSKITKGLKNLFSEKYKIITALCSFCIVGVVIIVFCVKTLGGSDSLKNNDLGTDANTVSEVEEVDATPIKGNNWLEESNQLVDLGLSVLWATQNIGADSPTDLGKLYEWDELMESCDGNEDVSCKSDTVKFKIYNGHETMIPTAAECNELLTDCTWTWIDSTLNNKTIVGYKVTGKNGNSIFLPAAGRMTNYGPEETPRFRIKSCNYWTSSSRGEAWSAMMYLKNNERTLAKRPKKDKLSVRVISRKK